MFKCESTSVDCQRRCLSATSLNISLKSCSTRAATMAMAGAATRASTSQRSRSKRPSTGKTPVCFTHSTENHLFKKKYFKPTIQAFKLILSSSEERFVEFLEENTVFFLKENPLSFPDVLFLYEFCRIWKKIHFKAKYLQKQFRD